MKKIKDLLKNLTPRQKLDVLEPLLKEKKGKENEQILTLIEEIKDEQRLIEESIKLLESKKSQEKKEESPLENIVEQEVIQAQQKKEETPLQLYGTEKKPEEIYGLEKLETKYLSPEARKQQEYKSEPKISVDRLTLEEEQNLINPEKRLEKQKKKYITGIS